MQVGAGTTWQQVAAGTEHTVATQQDGSIWAWGRNTTGQVGSSVLQTSVRLLPQQVGTANTWQLASAGGYHTIALRTDRTLWAWGGNEEGELGDGSNTPQPVPKQINVGTVWRSIATGSAHTLAVRADGTLWAWGRNSSGQVGDGTTTVRTIPIQIGTATSWQKVIAGDDYSQAVQSDGTLWEWGSSGQLTPTQVGRVDIMWQSLSKGQDYIAGIRMNGTLWTWGSNYYGQLGDGTTVAHSTPQQIGTATSWQSVHTGSGYGVALRNNGTLWAWGRNYSGQYGDGSTQQQLAPTQIGLVSSWRNVSAGGAHTVAIRRDSTLWAWGSNRDGQLGDGQPYTTTVPVLVYRPLVLATPTSKEMSTSSFQVVPNPAHGQVFLLNLEADAQVKLLSIQGRVLRTGTGATLVINDLSPGLYFIQVISPSTTVRVARLIVE